MATPNKFSNPDTPCCDCPMGYLRCFVTGPLFSVVCLPCVCFMACRGERQKRRDNAVVAGDVDAGRAKVAGEVKEPPAAQPPMFDAAAPPGQWPAEWRDRDKIQEAGTHDLEAPEGANEGKPKGDDGEKKG